MSLRKFVLVMNPWHLYRRRHGVWRRVVDIPFDVVNWIRYSLFKLGLFRAHEFKQMDSLKNKYEGKKAFLIGNGPSVNVEDLDKIYDSDFVTFGANRIHLAYPSMRFRPTFVVSADTQMINDFGQDFLDSNRDNVILVSKSRPKLRGQFFWFFLSRRISLKFSTNVYKDVTLSGGSLFAAMQVGYHMGIREFYLYGVDHSFKFVENDSSHGTGDASGDGNHFIQGYRSGKTWFAPRYELVETGFFKADQLLREQGGGIFNSTIGGRLEVLERIPLSDVLGGPRDG